MKDANALFAEAFGTFWLVFGGCGSAVLAAAYGNGGASRASFEATLRFAPRDEGGAL